MFHNDLRVEGREAGDKRFKSNKLWHDTRTRRVGPIASWAKKQVPKKKNPR